MNDILTTLITARASSEVAATAAHQLSAGDPAGFTQLLDRLAALAGLPPHGGNPFPSATAAFDTAALISNEATADVEAAPQSAVLPPDAAALATLVGQMQAAYLRPTASQTGVDSDMTPIGLAAPPATSVTAEALLSIAPAASDVPNTVETLAVLAGPGGAQRQSRVLNEPAIAAAPDSTQAPAPPSQVATATATLPIVTVPTRAQEAAARKSIATTEPHITTENLPGPTTAAPALPALARSAHPLAFAADALAPDEAALEGPADTPQFSQHALRDFLLSRTGSPAPAPEADARATTPHAVPNQAESAAVPHQVGQTLVPLNVDNAPVTAHANELANSVASAMNTLSLTAPRGRASPRTEAFDPAGIIGGALSTTAATNPIQEPGSPQLTIAPRLDTPEWKTAFAGGVRLLVQEGANSASLQLNPAELGPIDVRIQVTDQRADISFLVKSSDANAAIQSALSDLREQLARSGIELGQTNVGNQREHAQHPSHTPWRGNAQTAPVLPLADASQPAPQQRASGQIDTFA